MEEKARKFGLKVRDKLMQAGRKSAPFAAFAGIGIIAGLIIAIKVGADKNEMRF